MVKQVLPGKFAHTDYNFEKPSTSLMSTEEDQKKHPRADYEIYDYPGEYPEKSDGDKYAKVRMEELTYAHEVCTGESDSRGFCSGYKFNMSKHTRLDQNREYLILSTDYRAAAEDYETSGGQNEMCACFFTAVPSSVQYRPERNTPKPVIQGTQTAVVTGPSGEEIHTNKYGQVKVQFHWDREGKHDENSSCWIRVRQIWAGNRWGGLYIPRIGQEVIVDFLEGDPDQPIIVGTVYHANNMPPYDLPAEKTKSTIKSNSSLGGGGSNELRFEDKAGDEEVYVHAQKDLTEVVENDRDTEIKHDNTTAIGNDTTVIIGHDAKKTVGHDNTIEVKNDDTRTVTHDDTLTVNHDRTITVNNDLTQTIVGYKKEKVGKKDYWTFGDEAKGVVGNLQEIFIGNKSTTNLANLLETHVGLKISLNAALEFSKNVGKRKRKNKDKIEYESELEIELIGGSGKAATLKLNGSGVELVSGGTSIKFPKDGKITIKSPKNVINEGETIVLKGSKKVVLQTKDVVCTKKFKSKNIKDNG